MFGSTANRLAMASSDIDVLVYDSNVRFKDLYDGTSEALEVEDMLEWVEQIRTSKVPIIKVLHKETGLNFDISFNNEDSVKGLAIVMTMQEAYPELRPLFFVVKAFLKERHLHEPYTGGIGSFCLINMLVYYLQS